MTIAMLLVNTLQAARMRGAQRVGDRPTPRIAPEAGIRQEGCIARQAMERQQWTWTS